MLGGSIADRAIVAASASFAMVKDKSMDSEKLRRFLSEVLSCSSIVLASRRQ
jgi:hypothetical protein